MQIIDVHAMHKSLNSKPTAESMKYYITNNIIYKSVLDFINANNTSIDCFAVDVKHTNLNCWSYMAVVHSLRRCPNFKTTPASSP